MENKKYFLSLLIIVVVLFLGVGYAVVSSVYIKTGGTANVSDYELNVEITNAVASTNVTDKTVDFSHVLSNKNLTSNFTLNGMTLGEVVTITYTVTNNEKDVDTKLSSKEVVLVNSNSNYFNVSYDITDSRTDLANSDRTMEVVVFVELIKTPVSESGGSTTVDLTLLAKPYIVGEEVPIAYSYNGLELPKLPDFNVTGYDNAIIFEYQPGEYRLIYTKFNWELKRGNLNYFLHCNGGNDWYVYSYFEDYEEWKFLSSDYMNTSNAVEVADKNSVIWATDDVIYKYNSIPSDWLLIVEGNNPIPVYD